MKRVWITNGSTSVAPVINPLIAACESGFVPTKIYILSNPGIDDITDRVTTLLKTIVTAHGGDEPKIIVERLQNETNFDEISTYVQSAIRAAQDDGATVAVDITPGRRFWSIISFRAGLKYDVDRLLYTHVSSEEYFGNSYPEIPRTAVELIDFTEMI